MIKNLLVKALLVVGIFATTASFAQNTVTIQVGPGGTNTYSPNVINCTVGDTVKFVWVSGGHPTQSLDGTTIPLVSMDGSGGVNSEYKIKMLSPGTVPYECTAHGGMVGTIYVNAAPNLTGSNELFFSEYIEGSSNNKALEIYNPSSSPINMSGYSVRLFANGASTPGNTLNLPHRTLAAGDVYVIANASANASILAVSDTTSTVTFYNGDDALALYNGSTQIDAIGTIGTDPGTSWVVGSGTTLDFTLIRKPNVYVGTTDWAIGATQWDVLPRDTIRLNFHTVTPNVPSVKFNPTTLTINENAGTANVTLNITNPNASATSVDVLIKGGSASAGSDYTFTSQTVTFPANSSTAQSFTIPIIDDVDQESDETIELVLRNTTNSATIEADSIFTITISANDITNPVVNFVAPYSISKEEGSNHIFSVAITNPNSNSTGVKVYVKSTSTASSTDYAGISASGISLTFPASSSSNQSENVNIVDDAIAESAETVVLVLRDATNSAIIGNDSIITITIPQNDQPLTAHFIGTSANVNENAVEASISVMAMGASTTAPTSFDVVYKSGTATSGSDFTFTTQTITIPAAKDSTVVIKVPILNDNIFENDETVVFAIRNITNSGNIAADSIFTLTIKSDDILFKDISALKVNDANGVSVLKDSSVYIKGIVYGVDMQGSATSLQYTLIDPTGGVGIFRSGASSPPVISLVPEEGDSVKVYGKVAEFNGLTQVNMDSIILVSKGNPLKAPRVITSLDESTESDLVRFDNAVIVDTIANTASGTTLRIASGKDSMDLRIDADVNLFNQPFPSQRFSVIGIGGQFDNSNPKNSGYQLLPRYITDIIASPDPTIMLDSASFSVSEAAGTKVIKVKLSSPAPVAGSIRVAVTGGTATSGTDYTFTSPATLNFAEGATEAQTSFTIADDNTNEVNETIIIGLNTPVNCVIGSPASATITIVDNDPIGININKALNFNLFPNPATESVNVLASETIENIMIVNMIGQTITSINSVNETNKTVNVSDLSAGVYNVIVTTKNGSASQRLVIK